MVINHTDASRNPAPLDELVAALGGYPLPEPVVSGDKAKEVRKQQRHESKLRQEAHRAPRSFERFRILVDVVDQGRRVVELCDHKARYALVVMGILNAGVFFLTSRANEIARLHDGATPWLIGVLAIYTGLTFWFMFHAVDCLRPRRLRDPATEPMDPWVGDATTRPPPLGLLYWETIAAQELEAYGRAWGAVRMEQLNAELVLISHDLARLIRPKYSALRRLYWGLVLLVGLAAALLAVYTGLVIVQ